MMMLRVLLIQQQWRTLSWLSKRNYTIEESVEYNKQQLVSTETFGNYSSEWWNIDGPHRLYHILLPVRLDYIATQLRANGRLRGNANQPFEGLKVLDVGCGGGITCEGLAKLGAHVTGVDTSSEMIQMARKHADLDPLIKDRLTYINASAEEHAKEHQNHYDAITSYFMLEYVIDKQSFLRSCVTVLKPNGSIFLQYFEKTLAAKLSMVYYHKYVTKTIPKDPPDYVTYRNFLLTKHVIGLLKTEGAEVVMEDGALLQTNNELRFTNGRRRSFTRLHAIVRKPIEKENISRVE